MIEFNKQPRFAIYKTNMAIEIDYQTSPKQDKTLICTCHNFQTALRIAKQIGLTHRMSVIINTLAHCH
jgi:hypothetical protein